MNEEKWRQENWDKPVIPSQPNEDCDPFPLKDVLRILSKGVEILLHKKDYDGPDYEEMEICVKRAKEIMFLQSQSPIPVQKEEAREAVDNEDLKNEEIMGRREDDKINKQP